MCGSTDTFSERGVFMCYEYGAGVGTNSLRVFLGSGTAVVRDVRSVNSVITDTNWHHVVLSANGTGSASFWAVDGVVLANASTTEGTLGTGNATRNWSWGNDTTSATVYNILWFGGRQDSMLIRNRPFTANEISALYQLGRGGLGRLLTQQTQRRVFRTAQGNRRRRLICGAEC